MIFGGGIIIISNSQVVLITCCLPDPVPTGLTFVHFCTSTFHLFGLAAVKLPHFQGEKYKPEVCKPHWKKLGLILAQCAEGRS